VEEGFAVTSGGLQLRVPRRPAAAAAADDPAPALAQPDDA